MAPSSHHLSFLFFFFSSLLFTHARGKISVMKGIEVSSARLFDEETPRRYRFAENSPRNSGSFPGAPLASRNSLDAPDPSPRVAKRKHKKLRAWFISIFAGIVAGAVSGFVISVVSKWTVRIIKGTRNDTSIAIFSMKIKNLDFLDKDDGLASFEVIGRGGCGEVYKVNLPAAYDKTLAVKKIIQPSKNATELTKEDTKLLNKKMQQIKAEIQTHVGTIRHRNILPLLAHVSRPDCHFLVYEFMQNGSLQSVLNQVSQGNRDLDWPSRHRIAIGVAAGLEYLHNHTQCIIHRDLKPDNILLDDDMEARIGDFGLARELPNADTHGFASNAAGTLGYMAPEYYQTLVFTDKCDMYCFGLVLGSLVTGKFPWDDLFMDTATGLRGWMRDAMNSNDPERAIDPKLQGNGFVDQILQVLTIAVSCTLEDPKDRPSSKDVGIRLAKINH